MERGDIFSTFNSWFLVIQWKPHLIQTQSWISSSEFHSDSPILNTKYVGMIMTYKWTFVKLQEPRYCFFIVTAKTNPRLLEFSLCVGNRTLSSVNFHMVIGWTNHLAKPSIRYSEEGSLVPSTQGTLNLNAYHGPRPDLPRRGSLRMSRGRDPFEGTLMYFTGTHIQD